MGASDKDLGYSFSKKAFEADPLTSLQVAYGLGAAGSQQIQLDAVNFAIDFKDIQGAGNGLTIPLHRQFDELGNPIFGVAGLQCTAAGLVGEGVYVQSLGIGFSDDIKLKRVNGGGGGLFQTPVLELDTPAAGGVMAPNFGFGRVAGTFQPSFWFGGQTATDVVLVAGLTSNSSQGVRMFNGDVTSHVVTFEAGQIITDDYAGSWQNGHFVWFIDAEDPTDYGSRYMANRRGVFVFGLTEDALAGGFDVALTKLVGWTGAAGSGTPTDGNLTINTKVGGVQTDTARFQITATATHTSLLLYCTDTGTVLRVVRDPTTKILSAP